MTKGVFEKRWTLYGGWSQVLSDNRTWSKPCAELPTALAASESMRKEKAFKIAIFWLRGASRSIMMEITKLTSTTTESGKGGELK